MVSTWNLLTLYYQACDLSPSTLQSMVLWILLLLVALLLLLSALLPFFRQQIKVMTENFKPSNSENVLNCSHCIEFIPQRRYNIALKKQWKTTKNENKKARENVFVNRVAFTALFMLLMSVRSNLHSCLLTLRSLGWGNEDWTEQNPTEEGSLQAILTHKIGCGGKEN